jgi:hypothetical protein
MISINVIPRLRRRRRSFSMSRCMECLLISVRRM